MVYSNENRTALININIIIAQDNKVIVHQVGTEVRENYA